MVAGLGGDPSQYPGTAVSPIVDQSDGQDLEVDRRHSRLLPAGGCRHTRVIGPAGHCGPPSVVSRRTVIGYPAPADPYGWDLARGRPHYERLLLVEVARLTKIDLDTATVTRERKSFHAHPLGFTRLGFARRQGVNHL